MVRLTLPQSFRQIQGQYGPGGRHSVSGHTVAIFGATGFLGRYVCNELGQSGTTAYIGNRGDELETRHLKPMFDLGKTRQVFYSPRDKESIKDVIRDADTVVNLVGKYYETRTLKPSDKFPFVNYATNYSFNEAHVEIPKMIAEASKELGVNQLIHVSSLTAKPDATSSWSQSKWEGELAVRESFKNPTVLRPSQIFGPEDRLLNWFAIQANALPFIPLPLPKEGSVTPLISPVHCGDVADAVASCVMDPKKLAGKTYDLQGPRDFTYEELAEFVYDITGQEPKIQHLPTEALQLGAKGLGLLPNPILTEDQVKLWGENFQIPSNSENKTFEDLGLTPSKIERLAFAYLHRFRTGGHFAMKDVEGWHVDANLDDHSKGFAGDTKKK